MPPRPKRKPVASVRNTRSKATAQVPGAPSKPVATEPKKATKNGQKAAHGPSARPTRSNLVMEVVLPASKRPTPKSSSALTTPVSPALSPTIPIQNSPDRRSTSPLQLPSREGSSPLKFPASTPPAPTPGLQETGKQEMDLPPSSPPPNSSPAQGLQWDPTSDLAFSTPTPSPSRSRRPSNQPSVNQPTPPQAEETHLPTPHPSSPLADEHPDLTVVHSPPPFAPEDDQEEKEAHKPPTSPAPYSDTVAPEDPFGFVAAENRLRERRAQIAQEHEDEAGPSMPSSGGPESFGQSEYEEAFASIFYDPESGKIADPSATGSERGATKSSRTASLYDTDENEGGGEAGSLAGNGNGKAKRKSKRTMEVVIPTAKGKEKEDNRDKAKASTKGKEKAQEASPPKSSPESTKTKGKTTERVLTTYELETMLPRRIKRVRKPRTREAERISLSDVEDDTSSSPKRRKKAPATKGKAVRGTGTKPKKDVKPAAAGTSKETKSAGRSTKRTRSAETAFMDEETRKRFEAEQKRRLEAYKALDDYNLEEEEVVW